MSGFLLDTCAISELRKPRPNLGFFAWIAAAQEQLLFISTITLGEIRQGLQMIADGKKRTDLDLWLTSDVTTRFKDRIVGLDTGAADIWGRIAAETRKNGTHLSTPDAMIAAIALHHNLSVVTRNEDHFTTTGAAVINPWNESEQ